jgi:ABC-type lipoprotein release transport system permease subunit
MAAVWFWARRELVNRWRALVVLGILAGVAGGIATAAVAGARRTSTVFDRWKEATAAPDAIVFATQVGIFDADYTPVIDLPEVVDAATFSLAPMGVVIDGVEIGGFVPGGGYEPEPDDRLFRTVSRPLLDEGRLPDPDRADEVLVNSVAAEEFDLDVGSTVTIRSATEFEDEAPLDGPSVDATVVGIGSYSLMDIVFEGTESPGFIPSAAFMREYGDEVPHWSNLVVRLQPGTDVREFHSRVVEAMGLPDVPVRDLAEDTKRVTQSTDLERTGLLIFAAATLVAGLVLVGQAITRVVYGIAEATVPLRAMGATRRELLTGLCLPVVLASAVAGAIAVVLAVAISPLFPIGLGARIEPDPGLHADVPVLLLGAAVIGVLTLAIAVAGAVRATSRRVAQVYREPTVVRAIRARTALPVAIGAGLALERGRGERSLPVRPALVGAVVGVLGVVASFGLVRGIDDALAEPLRSGQVFDVEVYPDDVDALEALTPTVAEHDDVDRVALMRRVPLDVDDAGIPVYAMRPVEGVITFELLDGRAPSSPDEVALGPQTAKALGKGVGDDVRIGDDEVAIAHVVGIALLPQTAHSSFDQGAWMTEDGLAPLATNENPDVPEQTVVATLRPGVARDEGVASISEATGTYAESPSLPQDVTLLRNVRSLPIALAVFLVFLGLAALGHVLVSAAKRRRGDLAVLRALGFRPRQVAAAISWQATTVAILGLVLGIPLGVAAGRIAWRWIAERTPLIYVGPVAMAVVLIAIPATLLLANALAVLPGRRAARLRPAQILRTE